MKMVIANLLLLLATILTYLYIVLSFQNDQFYKTKTKGTITNIEEGCFFDKLSISIHKPLLLGN